MKTIVSVLALAALTAIPVSAKDKAPFAVGLDPDGTYSLSDDDIKASLEWGTKQKGKMLGLQLRDSAAGLFAGLDGTTTTGFSLEAYTPYSWIGQNASWAAKRYQEMTMEDVTEEMAAPIFTVIVHPDTPHQVSASGMVGTSGVDHVIVRSTSKKNFQVLQPTTIDAGSEFAWSAMGAEVELSSAVAYFPMDGVAQISSLDKKGEFFIVVIGDTGEEKKFKVKTKHFKRLP